MKKLESAIDRYATGKEKEVNASDFKDKAISDRRNRFFCPECGEVVFYRSAGINNSPACFYHKKRTPQTQECDQRVNSVSGLTVSQRVGLPIYLIRNAENHFQLNMGFSALGENLLDLASKAKYKIKISSDNGDKVEKKIDNINFIENEMTLIPINFIPSNGKNFTITYSFEEKINELQKKWSDYADGFGTKGAIFTYNDNGGKKIRRGDSISTNKFYYAVLKGNLLASKAINEEYLGKINIGKIDYNVFKFIITVSVNNTVIFNNINTYFYNSFGVQILEKLPEIISIWPPVIKEDNIFSTSKNYLICAVTSGNDCPKVYAYNNKNTEEKKFEKTSNGIYLIKTKLSNNPISFSVDRKYVGREITFLSKETIYSDHENKIELVNNQREVIFKDNIENNLSSREFMVKSNAKFNLHIGTKDKMYSSKAIRRKEVNITFTKEISELLFEVEDAIFRYIKFDEENSNNKLNDNNAIPLQLFHKGALVPIPRWFEARLRKFKQNNENEIYEFLLSNIKNGKIPLEIIKNTLYWLKGKI